MQKLGVATFLMLVLVQTALSAPAENNRNNKLSTRKAADPLEAYKELTEKLTSLVQHELAEAKAKFEGFAGKLTSPENEQKIKDLMAQLGNGDPVEASKKLIEEVTKMAQHEVAGAQAKLDELVKHVNSSETYKKVKALFDEVSNVNLAETYKHLKNIADRELARLKAKYEDLKAHMNTPEANQKLKDLMAEFKNIDEIYKRMTERMTQVVKRDLAGAKAKMDDLVKSIYSPETEKKLKELLGAFPADKLEEIFNKAADDAKKLFQHEVAAIKAKVEELVSQIKPPSGNN